MTGNEVRRLFLEYFEKHEHRIVRSSSLVPQDDPTLLFTNAGMVQFKRMFLGEEDRGYRRATTSQKCVRAGGKHNDLENVGYTARHHTFFEMLGNFSFGDYFKEKAIEFGWDLLTNGYGLPADDLLVSIYLDDDEAFDIWNQQIGVPADRIARFGEEDNFWAMGDTGPCGPCSEIHLDRGPDFGCGKPDCKLGCECDRFLEIWNLVFMQFNRDASGEMTPLPKPSIDTGLGLERMVSILQEAPTNFDIDLMRPIITRAEDLSEKAYGQDFQTDVALKVIADHSRAATFLIGDGILPANEGRGYVLRRIMRRAIRYGRNIGLDRPFLHRTASVVIDIMRDNYPDLTEAEAFITNVIENEEKRFLETLDNGLRLLNDTLQDLRAQNKNEVPGQVIFKLYDTFGFPVDIVRDVVRDERMTLDMEGFEAAMDVQRSQSRSVAAFATMSDAYKSLAADGFKPEFIGYDHLTGTGTVRLLVVDGAQVESAQAGQNVEIVTDVTPFYGESGGQVGDQGTISAEDNSADLQILIDDTVKDPTGQFIHKGQVVAGTVNQGDRVVLNVDADKRAATRRNHTATHILHAVLRKVLGDHIKQAGSMVGPDRLRFDFTHFSQIDASTIDQIETLANERICQNVSTETEEMEAEQAFQSGATALFEEKYGDQVRVVSLADFSKELCGGTHTQRTGDIGLFKIVSEASVASGVRRIEALTGEAALAYTQRNERQLVETARMLRVSSDNLGPRVGKLLEENKALSKELAQIKTAAAAEAADTGSDDIQEIEKGVKVLVKRVEVDQASALRDLADRFKDKLGSGIVVLGSAVGEKALLIVGVTKDLAGRYHAGKIVGPLAAEVGGGGGGRPDMAQAGGTKPAQLDQALAQAVQIVKRSV
jgi:alanyl-tRNA synthetase